MDQNWLVAPLFAAFLAAVGYVSKLVAEGVIKWNTARRERLAKLVVFQSLLLSSKAAFGIQNELVVRLCEEIRIVHPEIRGSYDQILAAAYPLLDDRQKLEHGLIRYYTTNCTLVLNSEMLSWLSNDTYFKAAGRKGRSNRLSSALQQLEVHLFLWRAKYEFWIPNKPERAIVYMADEQAHGVGFPTGIEALVAEETGSTINLRKLLDWSQRMAASA
jgi:hypothetical protein